LGLPAAFAALWIARRQKLGPYFQPMAVMAFCLLLVLDPGHLVYYAIHWIPMAEETLQSYNFLEGFTAMAALLTAMGIASFLANAPRRAAPRWALPVAVVAMAGWSARQLTVWARGGVFPDGARAVAETAVALALFAAGAWILRGECGRRRTAIAAAAILFVLCDYKVFGTNRLFNTRDGDVDELYPPGRMLGINEPGMAAMIANRHYRVISDGSPSAMDFRVSGLASPQGLDPLLTRRYRALVERWGVAFQTTRVFQMDYRNSAMLQALGVRYVISYAAAASEPLLAGNPDFRRVGPDNSFYRVYEYLRAKPQYEWDGVAAEAWPVEWLPGRRVFRIRSERGGRFGLVEQFFPGWRAAIDGRPAAIALWREAFQSIDVPPGEHTIAFEYRSRWLPLGAGISLSAFGALIFGIAAGGRAKAG
jgi:hypothetical protein